MKLRSKITVSAVSAVLAWGIGAGLIALYNSNAAMMDIGGPIDNGRVPTYGSNSVAKAPAPYIRPHSSKYTISWSSLDLGTVMLNDGAGCNVRGHFHAGSSVTATSIARTIASCGGGKTESGRKFTASGVYSEGELVKMSLHFYDDGPEPVTLYFQ